MVTFGDLVTRNFDGPADEEAGNIISILLFPVIVPIQLVYVTGLGAYKLGSLIKEHNPINYYQDRKESIKCMKEMASKGINPYKDDFDYEAHRIKREVSMLTEEEKKDIITKTESTLQDELSKTYLDESGVRVNTKSNSVESVNNTLIKKPKKLTYTYKK